MTTTHLTMAQLNAGLDHIRRAPRAEGRLELIVRRPAVGERETLHVGELDPAEGLVGDNWRLRGSRQTPDGSAHPEMQLTLMSARVAALIAQEKGRWALAGDQLYVDLDLSAENLPPGSRLAIGDAVVEVTVVPHTGCKQFVARFGMDAIKFVNGPAGKQLQLRGINTRVVQPGTIRTGDSVRKL